MDWDQHSMPLISNILSGKFFLWAVYSVRYLMEKEIKSEICRDLSQCQQSRKREKADVAASGPYCLE